MALGIDEGWDSAAGAITRGQLIDGTEHAWGQLEPGPLDAVRLTLVDIDETIALGESPEITTIAMTWPDYFARACGRVAVDNAAWRARVRIEGDDALAARLLSTLAVTP